jgi:hypothetical protein
MKADDMPTNIYAVRSCGMEARDAPRYRTQVNPRIGWSGLGKRAWQREALYPIVAGTVVGAAIAGHDSFLPQEISIGPRFRGRAYEGNDVCTTPMEKSDHPIVVMKPGNAGGAKGVTS